MFEMCLFLLREKCRIIVKTRTFLNFVFIDLYLHSKTICVFVFFC